MNLVWGHRGPYFHAPCQRDRFPSLVDEIGEDGDKLVAHLGISTMSDMGARLKRGDRNSFLAEQRSASNMKHDGEPLNMMFYTTSQGLRRGVDKFAQMPKFDIHAEDPDPLERHREIISRPNPVPAMRQAGEPPYTGNCQHCRSRGSNDVDNDFQGRLFLQQALLIEQINRNFD